MWVPLYFALFWLFTIAFIAIRSFQKEESTPKQLGASTILKAVPAGLAAFFVLVMRPSDSPFYILMSVAFVLCLLGDVGMDIGLLPGLAVFVIAQVTFAFVFLSQSLLIEITLPVLLLSLVAAFLIILYALLLIRYIKPGLGKLQVPVYVYTSVISLMLYSSVLLTLVSGALCGVVVVLGALLFVISDSLIGIREFHHRFSTAVLKVSGTYYLALFLLSLNVVVFLF